MDAKQQSTSSCLGNCASSKIGRMAFIMPFSVQVGLFDVVECRLGLIGVSWANLTKNRCKN